MNGSKRKPFRASVHVFPGPTRIQEKVLTYLPMLHKVNLSFSVEVQTEVPMSSWLHSALISAHPSRAASGHLDSAPTSGEPDPGRMLLPKHWPSGCMGSPFAGQGPDRWSNTAKDPARQHCGDSKAGFLFYLSLSLVT